MKINAITLQNWLKKIYAGGSTNEILIKTMPNGLLVKAISPDQTRLCEALLKKDVIENYEQANAFAIGNLKLFISLLNEQDKVELKFEEGKLLIESSTRKSKMVLISTDFIQNAEREVNLTFENPTISVPLAFLKKIIEDTSILNAHRYIIEANENNLYLRFGNEKENNIVENTAIVLPANAKVCINAVNNDVIETLTETNILLNTKTNYPLQIIEENESMRVSNIIAPIVEED